MSTEKRGNKLQIALYWAASCGGCEIGVLDIDEKILDLTAAADIVFWPVAVEETHVDALVGERLDVLVFRVNRDRPEHDVSSSGQIKDFLINVKHADLAAATACCPVQRDLKLFP